MPALQSVYPDRLLTAGFSGNGILQTSTCFFARLRGGITTEKSPAGTALIGNTRGLCNMEHDNCQTILSADLNLLRETIPPGLLSDEGYSRLAAVADLLPAALTNFWGLESRLHEMSPLTDILLEIKRNTPGHRLLVGQCASGLDQLYRMYPLWRQIRSFAAQWVQDQSLLNKHILNLWLEFDTEKPVSLEAAIELIGLPSVFLGFRSADQTLGELRELLSQTGDFLQIPGEVLENVVSFIGSIPPPGQLFQLGSMLGRHCRDIRLCINKLNPVLIPDWLKDMGWQGHAQALKAFLDMLTPIVRTMAVDLNLTETGISEKIGIECYLDWDRNDTGTWSSFLDRVSEYVHIHPSKRSGLLRYPGEVLLPVSRRKEASDTLSLLLFKMIHHVKLGFYDGGITDAKAYLAIYRPGIQPNNNWLVD